MAGQSIATDHLDTMEEDAKVGIDKDLTREVEQLTEFTDPNIDAQEGTSGSNLPRMYVGEDMHEKLDRV